MIALIGMDFYKAVLYNNFAGCAREHDINWDKCIYKYGCKLLLGSKGGDHSYIDWVME